MSQCDKLKTLNFIYINNICHQTFQAGRYLSNRLAGKFPRLKLNEPLITRFCDFDFLFVGLESKRLKIQTSEL